jgi:hypothetical protein
MEGLSFVTSVTGLNGPNTGKEHDDEDTDAVMIGWSITVFLNYRFASCV